MSSGTDDRHLLRVRDGHAEVVHPDDCPYEDAPGPFFGRAWLCGVGWEIANVGFDGLTDPDGKEVDVAALPDGDYRLSYSWHTPASMFEDADASLVLLGVAR